MLNELVNQLKSQTLGDVLPAAFKQVGNAVYPDEPALKVMPSFRDIVHSWAAAHAPTFGTVIPNSGVSYSVVTSDSLQAVIEPSTHEVIHVQVMSVTNAGSNPATVQVFVEDALNTEIIALPSTTTASTLRMPVLAKGATLKVITTDGTASDCTFKATSVKSCA